MNKLECFSYQINKIDLKGKIYIPGKYNQLIEDKVLLINYFNIHHKQEIPFLFLMSSQEQINKFLKEEDNYSISLIRNVWNEKTNKRKKISIPSEFREHAGILTKSEYYIFGKGNHLEIYNPENGKRELNRILKKESFIDALI